MLMYVIANVVSHLVVMLAKCIYPATTKCRFCLHIHTSNINIYRLLTRRHPDTENSI